MQEYEKMWKIDTRGVQFGARGCRLMPDGEISCHRGAIWCPGVEL